MAYSWGVGSKGFIAACTITLALGAARLGRAAEDRPAPATDGSSTEDTASHTAGPDKSEFNLFNPTPDDALRPFSTDRPGKTHSSLTVDAGHLQLEGDFWNYSWDHWTKDGTASRAYTFLNPNLKLGITNSTEFDMFFPVYNSLEIKNKNANSRLYASGFGDLLVGAKINFFGNDGGDRALAAIGFIKLPTAAPGLGNNMVEYVLNLPYTMALPNKFSLTFEPAVGLIRNLNKQGFQGDYQILINLNRPIIGETVTAAIEIALDFAGDHNVGARHTLDPSLQWLMMPNLQLDVGIYIGLLKGAPDWNPYVGISYRY